MENIQGNETAFLYGTSKVIHMEVPRVKDLLIQNSSSDKKVDLCINCITFKNGFNEMYSLEELRALDYLHRYSENKTELNISQNQSNNSNYLNNNNFEIKSNIFSNNISNPFGTNTISNPFNTNNNNNNNPFNINNNNNNNPFSTNNNNNNNPFSNNNYSNININNSFGASNSNNNNLNQFNFNNNQNNSSANNSNNNNYNNSNPFSSNNNSNTPFNSINNNSNFLNNNSSYSNSNNYNPFGNNSNKSNSNPFDNNTNNNNPFANSTNNTSVFNSSNNIFNNMNSNNNDNKIKVSTVTQISPFWNYNCNNNYGFNAFNNNNPKTINPFDSSNIKNFYYNGLPSNNANIPSIIEVNPYWFYNNNNYNNNGFSNNQLNSYNNMNNQAMNIIDIYANSVLKDYNDICNRKEKVNIDEFLSNEPEFAQNCILKEADIWEKKKNGYLKTQVNSNGAQLNSKYLNTYNRYMNDLFFQKKQNKINCRILDFVKFTKSCSECTLVVDELSIQIIDIKKKLFDDIKQVCKNQYGYKLNNINDIIITFKDKDTPLNDSDKVLSFPIEIDINIRNFLPNIRNNSESVHHNTRNENINKDSFVKSNNNNSDSNRGFTNNDNPENNNKFSNSETPITNKKKEKNEFKFTKFESIPPKEKLMKMTKDELNNIKEFTLFNKYGQITFFGNIDICNLDFDSIDINELSMDIKNEDIKNIKFKVEFKYFGTELDDNEKKNFIEEIKKLSEPKNLNFISFDNKSIILESKQIE